jgi:hypothetical protein
MLQKRDLGDAMRVRPRRAAGWVTFSTPSRRFPGMAQQFLSLE